MGSFLLYKHREYMGRYLIIFLPEEEVVVAEFLIPVLCCVTCLEQCKGKVNAVVWGNSCSRGQRMAVPLHPKAVSESSCGPAASN